MAHAEGQQHPISGYFKVWGWLFVLSAFSYMVDYLLIVAFFMHMRWERLALIYAILIPPVFLLVFIFLMSFEADYTFFTRGTFFAAGS
jgi:cytochrome c oxidase subunit IV